jgi:hypothetical protein
VAADIRRHQLEEIQGQKYKVSNELGEGTFVHLKTEENVFQGRLKLVIGRNEHA